MQAQLAPHRRSPSPVRETGDMGTGQPAHALLGAKYETGGSALLRSSSQQRWGDALSAELRRHKDLHCPAFVQPVNEVVLALSGAATICRRADGPEQKFVSRPGSACLCPRGVAVRYLDIAEGSLDMLHLYLPLDLYGMLDCRDGNAADAGLIYTGDIHDPLILQIGAAIADELQTESDSGRMLIESLGMALAARLVHRYARPAVRQEAEAMRVATEPGLDGRRLKRVLDYIHAHLESDLSLHALAAVACLSVYHFSRAFKRSTGRPPLRYVSDARIARAKELLASGRHSVDDVADTLGFSSGTNFARAFKKLTGVPPSTYRMLN